MKKNEYIKSEIQKLKQLRKRVQKRVTVETLKGIRGFENMSDKCARELLDHLKEFANIVLIQINRIENQKIQL